jgi:chemotaxis signal transduction protein
MVAVVSLRSLLGVGASWTLSDARIVVVAAGPLSAGLVVDEVSEILIVDTAHCALRETPDASGPIGGIARIEGHELQLLDVPRILGERSPAA